MNSDDERLQRLEANYQQLAGGIDRLTVELSHRRLDVNATSTYRESYIPQKEDLEGLDAAVPGSAAKWMDLLFSEAEHRRAVELRDLRTSERECGSRIFGSAFGLVACSALCAGVLFLAHRLVMAGNGGAAATMVTVLGGIGAILAAGNRTPPKT